MTPTPFLATHAGELCATDGTRTLVYLRSTGKSWRASNGQRYNARTGSRKGDTYGDHTLLVHAITRISPRAIEAAA
jgi:hypothetical protein